jgi:hypothetical protein
VDLNWIPELIAQCDQFIFEQSLTLWFMTRALDATGLRQDQEGSAGRKRKERGKFTFLAAWMAALSREDNPSLSADDYDDLATPPERHPGAASYCPRCKAQFRICYWFSAFQQWLRRSSRRAD